MGGASCTEQTMQEQEANNLVSSSQDACGHDCGTSSLHGTRGALCTIAFDGKLIPLCLGLVGRGRGYFDFCGRYNMFGRASVHIGLYGRCRVPKGMSYF
jgi:hypothetical protein